MKSLREILKRSENIDRDFRYVAFMELKTLAEESPSEISDSSSDISQALLRGFFDDISDVRTITVRIAPVVIPHLSDNDVNSIVASICTKLTDTSVPESSETENTTMDSAAIAIRCVSSIVREKDSPSIIHPTLTKLIKVSSTSASVESARIASMESLSLILPAISEATISSFQDIPLLIDTVVSNVNHPTTLQSQSSSPSKYLLQIISNLLGLIPNTNSLPQESQSLSILRSVFLSITEIISATNTACEQYFDRLISMTLSLVFTSIPSDPLQFHLCGDREPALDDLSESCLELLSCILKVYTPRYPTWTQDKDQLLNCCAVWFSYDPNYLGDIQTTESYMDDDDLEGFEGFEDFAGEDDDEYIAESDVETFNNSWKIRKSTLGLLIVLVGHDFATRDYCHSLFTVLLPSISRESLSIVSVEQLMLVKELVKQLAGEIKGDDLSVLFEHALSRLSQRKSVDQDLGDALFDVLAEALTRVHQSIVMECQAKIVEVANICLKAIEDGSDLISETFFKFFNSFLSLFARSEQVDPSIVLKLFAHKICSDGVISPKNPLIKIIETTTSCLITCVSHLSQSPESLEAQSIISDCTVALLESSQIEQSAKLVVLDLASQILKTLLTYFIPNFSLSFSRKVSPTHFPSLSTRYVTLSLSLTISFRPVPLPYSFLLNFCLNAYS
ncbi:hypothetical protein GEMRC1_004276 [Eukaryota sp. GEM-RC1]